MVLYARSVLLRSKISLGTLKISKNLQNFKSTRVDEPIIAAIDIGTNSIHLVVASVNRRGQMTILDSDKVTVRLGQHITPSGDIDREGIRKTVATMRHMKSLCAAWPCHIRAIATHAVREANNHPVLVDAVFKATGIQIEIVDGEEEGRLVFLGVRQGLALGNKAVLGLDIGGGSTEIVIGRSGQGTHAVSVKLGAVRLSVENQLIQRIDNENVKNLRLAIASRLEPGIERLRRRPFAVAVASSGTAKSLATMDPVTLRVRQGLDANGRMLMAEDLYKITASLERLGSPAAIRAKTGLDAARSEIIFAGAELMSAVTRELQVHRWVISSFGLREGIVIDTWQRLDPTRGRLDSDLRSDTIESFAEKFGVDVAAKEQTVRLALRLFDQLAPRLLGNFAPANRKHLRQLLACVAKIYDCGLFVSRQTFHRHSGYLITNARLPGFTQDERVFMGLMARYHRKSVPPIKLDTNQAGDLAQDEWGAMRIMSGMIRLAAAFQRVKNGRVKDLKIRFDGRTKLIKAHVITVKSKISEGEMHKARKELEALEKCWGMRISLDS